MKVRELVQVINEDQDIMVIIDCAAGFIRYASWRDMPPTILGATVVEVSPRKIRRGESRETELIIVAERTER